MAKIISCICLGDLSAWCWHPIVFESPIHSLAKPSCSSPRFFWTCNHATGTPPSQTTWWFGWHWPFFQMCLAFQISTRHDHWTVRLPLSHWQWFQCVFDIKRQQRQFGLVFWLRQQVILPACKAAVVTTPYSVQSQIHLDTHEKHTLVCMTIDCTWQ